MHGSELERIQLGFTSYLRNPDKHPVPEGLDERRINVYRHLIFNNVSSLLADFFPVLNAILSDQQWERLVRSFFTDYVADTPYFLKLAEEFVTFLTQREPAPGEPAFLIELAHYEWVELDLYTSEEVQSEKSVEPQLLRSSPLSLSSLAYPLCYRFQVHQIRQEFQPTQVPALPTCLLVFRDRKEAVRFFELQPLAYELLASMQEAPGLVPEQWLEVKAYEYQFADTENFITMGMELLHQLNGLGVFNIVENIPDAKSTD